jgi:shikimate kinase
MKKNLILIGPMGSGKSTVGRVIAEQIGWELIDTDHLIEETTGHSIPVLFREKGEGYFRRIEKEIIRGLSKKHDVVVATGGGTVLDAENRRLLLATGLVVYLKTDPVVLGKRIGRGGGRPLLAGKDPVVTMKELLKARELYYHQADEVVTTDGRTPAQIGEVVIRQAQRRGIIGLPPR